MGCGSSDASATPEATQDDEVSALATSSALTTTKSLKSYTSSKLKSSPTTRYADSLKKPRSVALLGSGDSGKSTVITRLKMLDTQQSVEEKDVGTLMWNNVLESISALVFFCVSANLEMPESTLTTAFTKFDKSVDMHRTAELAAEIIALWQDASIQAAFRRRSEFTLLTNTEYMMSRLDVLADPAFKPSVEDNLQARLKTTVAVPVHLELGGCKVDMVDIGGPQLSLAHTNAHAHTYTLTHIHTHTHTDTHTHAHTHTHTHTYTHTHTHTHIGQRNYRKSWAANSGGVETVVFVAAVGDYDLKLEEDGDTGDKPDKPNTLGDHNSPNHPDKPNNPNNPNNPHRSAGGNPGNVEGTVQ
jgi:hypothetical protein